MPTPSRAQVKKRCAFFSAISMIQIEPISQKLEVRTWVVEYRQPRACAGIVCIGIVHVYMLRMITAGSGATAVSLTGAGAVPVHS